MSNASTVDAGHGSNGVDADVSQRAYLVVREAGRTQVFTLDEGAELLFGRAPEANVRLEDSKASREHARIVRRKEGLQLVELGSRNGTRLNDETLRAISRDLRSGDLIHIGDVEILVAESAGAISGTQGTRLEIELARLLAADQAAVLLRISDAGGELDRLSSVLGGAVLVEEQSDGDYAALFSGPGAIDSTIAAIKNAAPSVQLAVARAPADGIAAADLWRQTREGAAVRSAATEQAPAGVVVADPAMVKVFELVRKVAPTPTTVLVLGETGVGKEVVAEQVHCQSPRAAGPFVRLACGSLPETLLESELFGHEKGAFTGAERRKIGYIEAAHGGTLFLDEIGELALPMQAKLLRVLESHQLARVGGREEIHVDMRVVAATNRNLEAEVAAGRFREDLYFRLSTFIIVVPPLRDRPAEVELLAELFARGFAKRMNGVLRGIVPEAMARLRGHRWPGNVRELRNAMERAMVLADQGTIRAEHLPESIGRGAPPTGPIRDQIAEIERRAIEEALDAEGGNQTRAAKRLGLSRRALQYKLEKHRTRA